MVSVPRRVVYAQICRDVAKRALVLWGLGPLRSVLALVGYPASSLRTPPQEGRRKQERWGLAFLVIRLDEIGDMVTTLPMIKALANDNPGAKIDLWCNRTVGEWMEGQDGLHRVWKEQAPPTEMAYDVVIEGREAGERSFML